MGVNDVFQAGDNTTQTRRRGEKVLLKITWQAIADAKGCSTKTVRRAVKDGRLDPYMLEGIVEYVRGERHD